MDTLNATSESLGENILFPPLHLFFHNGRQHPFQLGCVFYQSFHWIIKPLSNTTSFAVMRETVSLCNNIKSSPCLTVVFTSCKRENICQCFREIFVILNIYCGVYTADIEVTYMIYLYKKTVLHDVLGKGFILTITIRVHCIPSGVLHSVTLASTHKATE